MQACCDYAFLQNVKPGQELRKMSVRTMLELLDKVAVDKLNIKTSLRSAFVKSQHWNTTLNKY